MIKEPFSDRRHIQLVVRRELNREIRKHFRDLFGESDTWEPEVATSRGQMLRALLHEESDTIEMTNARMMLYYFTYGQARALQPAIYGMPVIAFQELFHFHPQIRLLFLEDSTLVEDGYEHVKAEISFRLMDEKHTTITPAKAETLAKKVRSLFGNNGGFSWKKGKEKWTYFDVERGYQLRLLAWNEVEAKKVIEQVLDIQGHTPNWEAFLTVATKKRSFPIVPGTHFIYGKQRRKPRDRPTAYVRFRYAELKIWGLFKDVTLVDLTGTRRDALIKN